MKKFNLNNKETEQLAKDTASNFAEALASRRNGQISPATTTTPCAIQENPES